MHSLPRWPGVSPAHYQSPPTTGKTRQGRVPCLLLPRLALNQLKWSGKEKTPLDIECNEKSGP